MPPPRCFATLSMTKERDYVLGTHEDEIARLGLQHEVWRPRALEAWSRAGFTSGQTLLDIGCGPGYATLDLADIVGPAGRVIALDRSRRFLDALEAARSERGLKNIQTIEIDLDEGELPPVQAEGAWSRWVFAFVKRPRELLTRVRDRLKPGGTLALHEYFHYSTWRLTPRTPEMEEFREAVIRSWRDSGGEPDIGLDLPVWLRELGFEIRSLRPIIEVVPPTSAMWEWPKVFIETGLRRLVDLGYLTADRAVEISKAFAAREAEPYTLMVTPAVLEVVAVRL